MKACSATVDPCAGEGVAGVQVPAAGAEHRLALAVEGLQEDRPEHVIERQGRPASEELRDLAEGAQVIVDDGLPGRGVTLGIRVGGVAVHDFAQVALGNLAVRADLLVLQVAEQPEARVGLEVLDRAAGGDLLVNLLHFPEPLLQVLVHKVREQARQLERAGLGPQRMRAGERVQEGFLALGVILDPVAGVALGPRGTGR